ncbi:MAG: copper amine oxidase N-terminal domain-containing protein [Oscillibacter sp.]|nr:copper amine oxidase N-terminal domain-containing protein [Oscillibacter sp.]
MKKLLSVLLTLAALSATLCLTAAAAETEAAPAGEEPEQAPAFVRVWGKVSPWDGEGIYLKNDSGDGSLDQVVIHPGDAPAVDAATGLPLDLEKVKEGDTLYVWAGPAMALSMPPQMSAQVIVGNVPADAAVPEFCEIAGRAVSPAPGDEGNPKFPLTGSGVLHTGGGELEVTDKTVYNPWLTRQIVRMEDLTPGTRVLVWKDKNGVAEKVQLLPNVYQGYVSTFATMHDVRLAVNGGFDAERDQGVPQFSGQRKDGAVMTPIRGVAEAAGYEVRWDKTLGVVVSLNGETVFSVQPGATDIQTPEGESSLSAPCLKEEGTTYLPLEDLCHWLNLYLSRG